MRGCLSRFCWLVLTAATSCTTGCAAYQVGPRAFFRPDIRTVHVPVFQSDSFRPNLGERLTEAVVQEIQLRTPYKVVHRPDADSVLAGRITSERKHVVAENKFDDARAVSTDLVVQVTWHDRRGEAIMQQTSFALAPLSFFTSQSGTLIPEGGQSIATAHQETIQRLARQIVGQMEARW
jgi:hypothetical protein